MKPSKQVNAVVFAGRVGSKMKPKTYRNTSQHTPKLPMKCYGGPMAGHVLYLAECSTLRFTVSGRTGRYVCGTWEEM